MTARHELDGSSWLVNIFRCPHYPHCLQKAIFFYLTSTKTTTRLPLDGSSSFKRRPDSIRVYWTTLLLRGPPIWNRSVTFKYLRKEDGFVKDGYPGLSWQFSRISLPLGKKTGNENNKLAKLFLNQACFPRSLGEKSNVQFMITRSKSTTFQQCCWPLPPLPVVCPCVCVCVCVFNVFFFIFFLFISYFVSKFSVYCISF